jgi:hypothetical protein
MPGAGVSFRVSPAPFFLLPKDPNPRGRRDIVPEHFVRKHPGIEKDENDDSGETRQAERQSHDRRPQRARGEQPSKRGGSEQFGEKNREEEYECIIQLNIQTAPASSQGRRAPYFRQQPEHNGKKKIQRGHDRPYEDPEGWLADAGTDRNDTH